jgi:16S rRNA (guanine966-N2)-methyltransferase
MAATKPARPPKRSPGKIRIVGGLYKRTPLTVPVLEGLRPTPDRVRETLFNWLGSLENKRCLDLFAGTGALGIEAASRGAKEVVLVESQRQAHSSIEDTLARLKSPPHITLRRVTAEQYISGAVAGGASLARFDVVFLDPPFGEQWLEKLIFQMPSLLSIGGRVYAESEVGVEDFLASAEIAGRWSVERAAKAGQVYYQLLKFLG